MFHKKRKNYSAGQETCSIFYIITTLWTWINGHVQAAQPDRWITPSFSCFFVAGCWRTCKDRISLNIGKRANKTNSQIAEFTHHSCRFLLLVLTEIQGSNRFELASGLIETKDMRWDEEAYLGRPIYKEKHEKQSENFVDSGTTLSTLDHQTVSSPKTDQNKGRKHTQCSPALRSIERLDIATDIRSICKWKRQKM